MEYDFPGDYVLLVYVVKGLLNLKVTIIIFICYTGKQKILPCKYFFKYQYTTKYNQEDSLCEHLQQQVEHRLLQSLYISDVNTC